MMSITRECAQELTWFTSPEYRKYAKRLNNRVRRRIAKRAVKLLVREGRRDDVIADDVNAGENYRY